MNKFKCLFANVQTTIDKFYCFFIYNKQIGCELCSFKTSPINLIPLKVWHRKKNYNLITQHTASSITCFLKGNNLNLLLHLISIESFFVVFSMYIKNSLSIGLSFHLFASQIFFWLTAMRQLTKLNIPIKCMLFRSNSNRNACVRIRIWIKISNHN